MERLINIIRNNAALVLVLASFLVVISAIRMVESGRCLQTRHAAVGIVSLELAWDKQQAFDIRKEWKSGYCNGAVINFKKQTDVNPQLMIVNRAKENIQLDFIFLVAYTFFFAVAIILVDGRRNYSNKITRLAGIMLALSVGAGVLDAVENIFMMMFLSDLTDLNFLFALPATIKFFFVTLVIIYTVTTFVRSSILHGR